MEAETLVDDKAPMVIIMVGVGSTVVMVEGGIDIIMVEVARVDETGVTFNVLLIVDERFEEKEVDSPIIMVDVSGAKVIMEVDGGLVIRDEKDWFITVEFGEELEVDITEDIADETTKELAEAGEDEEFNSAEVDSTPIVI